MATIVIPFLPEHGIHILDYLLVLKAYASFTKFSVVNSAGRAEHAGERGVKVSAHLSEVLL